MKLTDNFTLYEIEYSSTAKKYKIKNDIPQEYLRDMIRICTIAEKLRKLLGRGLKINSGYRSSDLNKKLGEIGGYTPAKNSQHMFGRALDLKMNKKEQIKCINFIDREKINVKAITYYKRGQRFLHINLEEETIILNAIPNKYEFAKIN